MTQPLGPGAVAVIGDWHGSTQWALGVLENIAAAGIGLGLHLGDFGIWPGRQGKRYLDLVEEACDRFGIVLWVTPGNHEDYAQVNATSGLDALGRRVIRPHILLLPRGHRWRWHGRIWLSVSGGISIDRVERREGYSYWPQEAVTDEQADSIIAAGMADVMVAHDCPSGVTHAFAAPPKAWLADIRKTEEHRQRIQRIVDAVQPSYYMHGHLHRSYERWMDWPWGSTRVTGFDCDGTWSGNWAVLDVRTMSWLTLDHEGD